MAVHSHYGHGYRNSHGGADTSYQYGHPAGGSTESNVVAQWLFDEASGDIVDEVASLTLADAIAGGGSLTYAEENDDYSANLNPGILMHIRAWFAKTLENDLDFGTGDGTVEWVAEYESGATHGATTATVFYTCDDSVANGVYLKYSGITTTPKFDPYIKTADGTLLTGSFTLATDPFGDGLTHKHRFVMDRSASMEYFIDGVSQGSASMETLDGKTIPASQTLIGVALSSGVNAISGWLYELRVSKNATNNSGGPGGG